MQIWIQNVAGVPVEVNDIGYEFQIGEISNVNLEGIVSVSDSDDLITEINAGNLLWLRTSNPGDGNYDPADFGGDVTNVFQSGGGTSVAAITDTDADNPSDGDVLVFDSATETWVATQSDDADLASVTLGLNASVAIPTSWANVDWQLTHVENKTDIIEHDNTNIDRVLIKETGLYTIAYSMSFDADAGEETIEGRVVIDDTTVVPGSLRRASEDDEINDLSNVITAELTTGTYLTFQTQASGTGNLTDSSTTFMITRAKASGPKGDKGDTGTIGDLAAVQARRSTVLNNIPLTWTDLNFDVTDFENEPTVIEHLAPTTQDRIQVKEAGTYEIYYFLSADDEVQGRVRVNDSTVLPGSTQQSGDPGDSNNVVTPLSVKVYATLSANDFLTVQIQAATTAENLFVDALFLVKKLEGAAGEDGAPGAGSTVNVRDEGTLVPNSPFDSINFVGDGVTATDAGSGQVDVTIPGANPKAMFLAHNGVTTQTLTGTAVTALYNTSVRSDSIFSYSAGVVTVSKTAWFKITAEFTTDSTGSRSTGEQQLVHNGSPITGTQAYTYSRNSSQGRNTVSTTWLLSITSGDTVSVNIREDSGTIVTEENANRLLIEEVDDPS